MRREGYWDYMARRLREEAPMLNNSIHRSLHLKLDDHEKRRVTAVFDQVDILKKNCFLTLFLLVEKVTKKR